LFHILNRHETGKLQTYWLHLKDVKRASSSVNEDNQTNDVVATPPSSMSSISSSDQEKANAQAQRMVGWAVDILSQLLKQIVATRNASLINNAGDIEVYAATLDSLEQVIGRKGITVHEEVTEFVPLPKFDPALAERVDDFNTITLDAAVVDQLRLYVSDVAGMYRDNPFHNMEHATHVTMSISKLLGRIVSADVAPGEKDYGQGHILARLHDRTYGITS
jgi:hypothetical protein